MPRPTHRESTASIIHIFSRGNYKSPIFATVGAKQAFMITLKQAINRCGWEVYAYAIMPNHFHLLLRTPRGNLSIGMQWLLSTFATRFNKYRKESGHVFQGRYRYVVAPTLAAASRMFDYVHLNHVRKGLCNLQTLEASPDNSLYLLRKTSERPPFALELGLRRFTGYTDDAEGQDAYVRKLIRVLAQDPDGALSRDEMQKQAAIPTRGSSEPSPLEAGLNQDEIRAIDERHRDEFLRKALIAAGKSQAEIISNAKGTWWKAKIALALSHHTTASTSWIASKLNMGTPGHVRKILSNSTGSDRF
jgi:REP element-mobilizing transposase RayT